MSLPSACSHPAHYREVRLHSDRESAPQHIGDSSLKLPPMTGWVDLPRMELFSQDGFPFNRWPDGRETVVFLAEKNLDTLSAALNLLAIASQKIGYPAYGVRFSLIAQGGEQGDSGGRTDFPGPGGPPERGPDSDRRRMVRFPIPAQEGGPGIQRRGLLGPEAPEPVYLTPAMEKSVTLLGRLSAGRQAAWDGESHPHPISNPHQMGRSVLLLSADTSKNSSGAVMMWEPVVQGQVRGMSPSWNSLLLNSSGQRGVGVEIYYGDRGSNLPAEFHPYSYPWLFSGS